MENVIVTGATGFLGAALVRKLLRGGGKNVYGVAKNKEKLSEFKNHKNFHEIILDFSEYDRLADCIEGVDIDLFFHAAYQGVNGFEKMDYHVQLMNLEAACATVEQAIKIKCKRYIYIGSVDEYEIAKMPDALFCEPTHSRIYGAAKYAAEVIGKALAFENGMEYVSGLLSLTYGEGNKTAILPNTIIRNAFSNTKTLLINGDNYFDIMYVEDAVNGLLAIGECGRTYESYFIGHEQLRTFKDIVLSIGKVVGNIEGFCFGQYPDPSFSVDFEAIDRGKLFRDTGFKCEYDFNESILRTFNWLKSI